MSKRSELDCSPLGKKRLYPTQYDASLLYSIQRKVNRKSIAILNDSLPFSGEDIWCGYEISWLSPTGKPEVRIAHFYIPAESENIVESKSFKLYLNSFNQTCFDSEEQVISIMKKDISSVVKMTISLFFYLPDARYNFNFFNHGELLLDNLDVTISRYDVYPNYLKIRNNAEVVSKKMVSHLLKSNCPVTGQPDWATLYIQYEGREWDDEGLLKYLISFRNYQDFHEHCIERVFMEISEHCRPDTLYVKAFFTRRGGLEINPVRYSHNFAKNNGGDLIRNHYLRAFRQ